MQTKEIHGEGSHEPGYPQDPGAAGFGGLVCSLGAIGRALQEKFDPQGFLKEFSAHVQRVLPHDRLMIAYLEDEGRTFTVFAEYAAVGPLLHEGHYTVSFDPGGRYTPNDWDLDVEIANGIAAQVVLVVQHQRLAGEQRRLAVAEERARKLEQRYDFHQILWRSASLREVLARAEWVAPTETTVLLTGESGTGKELVARAIHYARPPGRGPVPGHQLCRPAGDAPRVRAVRP